MIAKIAKGSTFAGIGRYLYRTGKGHEAHQPSARHAWQQALTILDDLNHPDAEQVRTKLQHFDRLDP